MTTFGQRLRALRMENHKTGEELGKIFNVTKTAVSNWENGNRFPDEKTLRNIAGYFNVTVDYLLGVTDIENPYDTVFAGASGKNIKEVIDELSKKDKKDIAKHLEETMELLEQQESLMFDGEAMDEETKELLRQSLENSMRMAKAINKKYTPKKHRK